ncbi:hypothetical protein HOF92_04530, partial [bacterium]|nr:hypothetical protein [bacterium]
MYLLSYPLDSSTPAYGNGEGLKSRSDKNICEGDSCNTLHIEFSNHLGTHVDCPLHFDSDGASITDYEPDFWNPGPVGIVEIPAQAAQLLDENDLLSSTGYESLPTNIQALLLKTGWGSRRQSREYWESPPGYLPSLADWMRNRFPELRFFGFDSISLSSFAHRDVGREAHRAFLKHQRPILILEDLNLVRVEAPGTLSEVLISPLFLSGADGAPCTIWAR